MFYLFWFEFGLIEVENNVYFLKSGQNQIRNSYLTCLFVHILYNPVQNMKRKAIRC